MSQVQPRRRSCSTSLPFYLGLCALKIAGCGSGPANDAHPVATTVSATDDAGLARECRDGGARAERYRNILRMGKWSDQHGIDPFSVPRMPLDGCVEEEVVASWLTSDDPRDRHIAALLLERFGRRYTRDPALAARVVDAWTAEQVPGNWREMAGALERIDLDATNLLTRVDAESRGPREPGARALWILGALKRHPRSEATFALIKGRLDDRDSIVSQWAMEALRHSKTHEAEVCAVAAQWVSTRDDDRGVRIAVETFFQVDGCGEELATLLGAVESHLANGGSGRERVQALVQVCEHPAVTEALRERAARAAERLAACSTLSSEERTTARKLSQWCRGDPITF